MTSCTSSTAYQLSYPMFLRIATGKDKLNVAVSHRIRSQRDKYLLPKPEQFSYQNTVEFS